MAPMERNVACWDDGLARTELIAFLLSWMSSSSSSTRSCSASPLRRFSAATGAAPTCRLWRDVRAMVRGLS